MKIVQTPEITIYQGLAADWTPAEGERVDVVVTNPYGYLPVSLERMPMLIHQWIHRKAQAELWARTPLPHLVSLWNHGKEAFWTKAGIRRIWCGRCSGRSSSRGRPCGTGSVEEGLSPRCAGKWGPSTSGWSNCPDTSKSRKRIWVSHDIVSGRQGSNSQFALSELPSPAAFRFRRTLPRASHTAGTSWWGVYGGQCHFSMP